MIIIKRNKLLLLLLFLISFFTFNSKTYASSELIITSNNYSNGDKVFLDETFDILNGNALQLYAFIGERNEEGNFYIVQKINLSGVTWASDNQGVASVDNNGKVTGLSVGKAIISATYNENTDGGIIIPYNTIITVNVTSNAGGINTSLKIRGEGNTNLPSTLEVGKNIQLTALLQHGSVVQDVTNAGVTWASSNSSVASVDSNGKVTGLSVGEAIISATYNENTDGGIIIPYHTIITINVTSNTGSIDTSYSLNIKGEDNNDLSSTLEVGKKIQLTALLQHGSAVQDVTKDGITWTSSNTNIANVSNGGLVTAIGVGSATITAKYTINNKIITDTHIVDVKEIDGSLLISSKEFACGTKSMLALPSYMNVGDKIQLIAKLCNNTSPLPLEFEGAHDLIWTSSNESIATVNNGLIDAKSEGQVTISAKYTINEGSLNGKTFTKEFTINVNKTEISQGENVDAETTNPKTGFISIIVFVVLIPILVFFGLSIKNKNKLY